MTLLFQRPSIGLTLLTIPQLLRATRVVFYRPYWMTYSRGNPARHRPVEWLIHLLNRRAVVTEQEPEEAFPLAYDNNLASDHALEEIFPSVRACASFSVLREWIADPNVDRFYKIRMLPWVLYETQFYRTARHTIGLGAATCVIPDSYDRYAFHREFLTEEEWKRTVPAAVRAALWMKDRLGRGFNRLFGINLLFLVATPLYFFLKTAWCAGIRRRAVPVRADVVMPLISGFSEDGTYRGLKTGPDNSYLLGDDLTPSRVAFYFSDWSFTREERRSQEERMRRRGIRYFDARRLPLTPGFLREALGDVRRLLEGLLRRLAGVLAEDRRIAWASAALCYNALKERLFTTWVEYKVHLEAQDYSSSHVVRTILSEKLARLTAGDHHGAPNAPTGFPVLRYTHIHRHAVWGEAFLRAHGSHWDPMRNVLIGSWRTDFVKAAQESPRLEELQDRFRRLYGGRRPLAVILFPTLGEHNDAARIREAIEGLRLLRAEVPGDLTVVSRFRSVELADRYRAMGLEAALRKDPRIVIDLTDFSTYEWFALADLVIVSGTSTGIIEAAAAGKPAFTFDYQWLAERVFASYGKDLILRDRQDLLRVFRGIPSKFLGFDCQWQRLASNFSRYSDGKCLGRFRRVILDAVEEVEANRESGRRRLQQPVAV